MTKYSILFASKKDDKLRLCVDYRKLNKITIKDRTSLLNIKKLQNKLKKVKWFTKLNLRGAYNLIRMKKEKKWKTTFRTRYKSYEYLVMSFELINASITCQNIINDTLHEYLDIIIVAYLNDILVFFDTLEKHREHVRQILRTLSEKNFLFKSKKCEFHKQEVNFYEFKVRIKEIKIDLNKLKFVQNWLISKNVKEIQEFFEFMSYNKKFIAKFFKKVLSLIKLTKQNVKWEWNKKEQKAFESLKEVCLFNIVLKISNMTKLFRMRTNASNLIIETFLNQKNDNDKWHSITYYSRKLSSTK